MLVLCLTFALFGCDAGLVGAPDELLVVEPADATIASGSELRLEAHGLEGGDETPVSGTVSWISSDPRVADVSREGVVTALLEGRTIITATTVDASASVEVTVESSPASARRTPKDDTASDSTTTGSGKGGKNGSGGGGDTGGDTGGGGDTGSGGGASVTGGIWIGAEELAALPTSGGAWTALLDEANRDCGTPDLSNQDQRNNVCVMAKALAFARTGQTAYRDGVVSAITSLVGSGTYSGRALALGRELAAYVIAADLIGLASHQPSLDTAFRAKLRELLVTPTIEGPDNLIECNEERPNNWGLHCGASRAAVAVYLGDDAQLARVAQVFKGWLGDRSSYAGFSWGELSWQCDGSRPVGINPTGCTRDGHVLDGVLPDDQRRGGSYTWPAPKENYVWEALQGALAQAVILSRAGYDVWSWSDRALLRAFRWLHEQADFPAAGDDAWQPHLVNRYYGTSFPAPTPTTPGKNVGWTDWTHR